jgi:hypothetical protein
MGASAPYGRNKMTIDMTYRFTFPDDFKLPGDNADDRGYILDACLINKLGLFTDEGFRADWLPAIRKNIHVGYLTQSISTRESPFLPNVKVPRYGVPLMKKFYGLSEKSSQAYQNNLYRLWKASRPVDTFHDFLYKTSMSTLRVLARAYDTYRYEHKEQNFHNRKQIETAMEAFLRNCR